MFGEDVTWFCHVCGEDRPDARVSVVTHDVSQWLPRPLPPGSWKVNVRYCNDRADCEAGARACATDPAAAPHFPFGRLAPPPA